jgi:hypothetical protein
MQPTQPVGRTPARSDSADRFHGVSKILAATAEVELATVKSKRLLPNLNRAALDYLFLNLAIADKNDTITAPLFHDRLFCSIIFQ